MHFQMDKSTLLAGIRVVEKAISTNNTLQIISGIHLQVNQDKLTLTANNLEISIRTTISCTSMEEGSVVLDGKLLANLVRKLPDEIVIFNKKESQVVISAGTTEFTLNEIVGDNFPEPPKCDQHILSLTDYELNRLANNTLFCASNEEERPMLTGILIEIKDKNINFVATDSNRLSFTRAQTGTALLDDFSEVVPNKNINELVKILPMDETNVDVYFGDKQLAFVFGSTSFTTRVMDGTFPNYLPVLYTEQAIVLTIKRQQFLHAIDRASLFVRSGNHPVFLEITDGILEMGIHTELGKSSEQINVEHTGENGKAAYSPRFIMEMLKVMDSEQVELRFEPGPRQALIKPADNDDHLYILMPIRI